MEKAKDEKTNLGRFVSEFGISGNPVLQGEPGFMKIRPFLGGLIGEKVMNRSKHGFFVRAESRVGF
ncbi:hypothetical protein GCM10007362_45800 [Saccharibacillus endophyticus]|uniref:Uncharacterized protein n=1 Tax=Saccharibacillus endophyticus TaxID=2060666 RepID=A0ABQ2A822_9BACL|nr:hypothetical protein GCM10007362_45800 [Saccharibacillus endophyticus]